MTITENGYGGDRLCRGDKLIIGNGIYGYRGTLEENGKNEAVALTTCSFYDRRGDSWREPVNMPNPLYLRVKANGTALSKENVAYHTESLNTDNGVFSRCTVFKIKDVTVTLKSERFFSQIDYRLLISKVTLSCDKSAEMEIADGIDLDVWDINGPHFTTDSVSYNPLSVYCTTNEGKHLAVTLYEKCPYKPVNADFSNGKVLNFYKVFTKEITLERFAVLYRSDLDKCDDGKMLLNNLKGYDDYYKENLKWWREKWKCAKIEIEDERNSQLALDYSLYQLIIYAPKVSGLSISARGLSGQTYKGAVFWDTEMFMIPFYLKTDKNTAKNLIRYRIDTLDKAKQKAREYGYEGAFYAWESQDGVDACSDFNVTDVFTGRPVRTYFKDKQIHISADIAVALYQVYKETKDIGILNDGIEVLLECAYFYYTRSYYNHIKKRYELLDVLGPDEYHERVDNNAYTNYMAHETACLAIKGLKELSKKSPERYREISEIYKNIIPKIKKFKEGIYLPKPNDNGLIEQFSGYFKLEDTTPCELKKRLKDPKEYWGGSTGVATATRVIKQADVVMLLCVLKRFPLEVLKANYEFYLPYTEHGSSLSYSAYARLACKLQLKKDAYEWFIKTARTDLDGGGKKYAGSLYIGGTHPAACGGAYLTVTEGFLSDGLNSLPDEINSITVNTQTKKYKLKRN